jgi:thiaminase (transcriptional activator TenA)
MWADAKSVYAKTLEHPFLLGLQDGTLDRKKFNFYLEQDAHYLRAFAQALNVLASKAPREEWAVTLNRHALETLEVERKLHESIAGKAAILNAEPAPSNYAYTSHLLRAVHQGSFAEGLAAMLPCYWIYWEVGKELKKRGSKDPDYRRWIDQYSDPAYGKVVDQVLTMMNALSFTPAERQNARRLFMRSARYEYLFWDAAWRLENWQP